MKMVLFLMLVLSQNAFALYGARVQKRAEGFVVSLYADGFGYFCSGVLISPTRVLTAAHCIDGVSLELHDFSHALVYRPENVLVSIAGKSIRARSVSFAQNYFEAPGFEGLDLALIELSEKVTHVAPILTVDLRSLRPGTPVTLIAKDQKVSGKIEMRRNYEGNSVLFLNASSGACRGDSGGAVVVTEKGQQKLAGILMYDGEGTCERKRGYAYYPRGQF